MELKSLNGEGGTKVSHDGQEATLQVGVLPVNRIPKPKPVSFHPEEKTTYWKGTFLYPFAFRVLLTEMQVL